MGAHGYTEEEYFAQGMVRSYKPVAPLSEDGRWQVVPDGMASYKTRDCTSAEGSRARTNASALVALAGSRDRGEADRARAILLTLSGWSSPRIAEAFSVREDTVRLWRGDFSRGGTDVLKASVAPGPPPVKSERPCAWSHRYWKSQSPTDPIGRSRACVRRSRRAKACASAARNCPRRCEKKFRYRRPRHTLKGRQVASEVDRIGLRLQLREQQAKAGDIVLLYGDESEALTHPYLARAWAKSGADLRVPAPGQAKKVAMLGSLNHVTHELIVHTSPTKRSSDFVAHLEQIDALYGPMPGRASKPVVLVEDNGPIHVSKLSRAALAARAHWLTVEWLPKYTPELNDIEVVWHDLKAYNLAHQTFTGVAELDGAIHKAVEDLNRERMVVPLAKPRIVRRCPSRFAGRRRLLRRTNLKIGAVSLAWVTP